MIILITEEDQLEEDLKGILVDEAAAKGSPCRCYLIPKAGGRETKICFSKGIIGALSPEQIEKYCPTSLELKSGPLTKKVEHFIKCSEEAEKKGLGLLERIEYMKECLKEI